MDDNSSFKPVRVTNALDGSKDYLVSDKIFNIFVETMRNFSSDMTQKSPPNTIKQVIISIIPPKAIKREKNTKDSELFDGVEMEAEVEGDEEIDVNELSEELQSN